MNVFPTLNETKPIFKLCLFILWFVSLGHKSRQCIYSPVALEDFSKLPNNITEFMIGLMKTLQQNYPCEEVILLGTSI